MTCKAETIAQLGKKMNFFVKNGFVHFRIEINFLDLWNYI